MRIELGTVLNAIDDVKEHLKEQDYITCMNVLRDANQIILQHEKKMDDLWFTYYNLRCENGFYILLLDFIGIKNIEVPRSFIRDRNHVLDADDYLSNFDDSDKNYEKIDNNVIKHWNNVERIKEEYEQFMSDECPELIDEAAEYIMKHSGYGCFDFCGKKFE